jgi:SAM-dependent methyltransferase
MSIYDQWADYYDLIHQGLPGEAEFYVGQAVRIGGRTLELGCGTGRIAIPMAMCGANVVGVDNSAAMLAICREKCHGVEPLKGALGLVQADITALCFSQAFNYVAMPYRTFMHLLTPPEQRAFFEGVHDLLAEEGMFIFNTWVPRIPVAAVVAAEKDLHRVDCYEFEGGRIEHDFAVTYDYDRQWMHEQHRLTERDTKGKALESTQLELVRRWTSPAEIQELVNAAGLEVEAIFGDFDCNPFDNASSEMIWVLRPA